MNFYKRRFVALAGFLLGIIFALPSPQDFINFAMVGIVGFALIWFSEALGNSTGWWTSSHGSFTRVDKTSPPIFIEVVGWLVLLLSVFVFL